MARASLAWLAVPTGMKERIDKLLLDRGLVRSRQQAQALILGGDVLAGDQRIDKPGTKIESTTEIRLKSAPLPYVSRGGLKLEKALQVFAPDIRDWVCLDIGASTGGFTDCLLQRGAARVYTIDVGHNQLDWKLRSDPRVVWKEGVNARYLKFEDVGVTVDLISMDLSFISLTLVLPVLRPFTRPATRILCLVKPQFEVGKGNVGKGGVVRDPVLHTEVVARLRLQAEAWSAEVKDVIDSPLLGSKGNKEFLFCLQKR